MKKALVGFSIIWVLIGVFLLSQSGLDSSNEPLKIFRGLTANELGDFLAGFFAPLAFIWLAAAVYIQSQELAEQRKELQLTREVAIEAKEATKAQAEEARRSGDYFAKQTEFMDFEHNSAVHEQALELWKLTWQQVSQQKDNLIVKIHTAEPSGRLIERRIDFSRLEVDETISSLKKDCSRYERCHVDIDDLKKLQNLETQVQTLLEQEKSMLPVHSAKLDVSLSSLLRFQTTFNRFYREFEEFGAVRESTDDLGTTTIGAQTKNVRPLHADETVEGNPPAI
ncbi:hypothetical protein [uncultured Roseibium sp.]|uniref:hypothetical protein n=1 Tax=uncultured Roseibium sp. TaxID=1936171 RepID=UPI00263795DC|nr:hypothetical protein [uncultured Roseibium sp.]